MNLLDQLNKKELSDLLSKCWMTHDGMWFYNCFLELGIEKANKLNKSAISSLAAIEIKRFKKALGIKEKKIETFEAFKNFFSSISDILIPEFMNVSWSFPENNIMRWEFNDQKISSAPEAPHPLIVAYLRAASALRAPAEKKQSS